MILYLRNINRESFVWKSEALVTLGDVELITTEIDIYQYIRKKHNEV